MLVSLGRQADALKLYEAGEERLRESMTRNPDAPVWWNDLAWLSARCDQKLDEALEMSKRAVAADPDNAAYIDTLAEVYFRLGNPAEAVKLETRALQIEPGDIFMTKQLERFKAGVK
jgi:tetratricopeptide (TPR) repeat protein